MGYGENGYITGDGSILYTIFFENQASATAPAERVVVSDQLSTQLDWSTLELFSFGFNNVDITIPPGLQNVVTTTSVPTDPNRVRVRLTLI